MADINDLIVDLEERLEFMKKIEKPMGDIDYAVGIDYGYELCINRVKAWLEKQIPAADVRPVVLCQACKHWTRESDESWLGEPGWGSCFNDRYWGMENSFCTTETFYCADGERRDTNDGRRDPAERA